MSRLDSSGVLHDRGWAQPLAMDAALRRTVTVDDALRQQREAAEEARAKSPLSKLIPHYYRLP